MTAVSGPPRADDLVKRATNMILRPSPEWDVIDGEAATVPGLFKGYAMILAAIGPVCSALGMMLIGMSVPFVGTLRIGPVAAITNAIVTYVIGLAMVFVFGLVIDALAPNFGGVRNRVKAMQVAVYTGTATWLAGVFGLVPMLGFLSIVGLYGLYLLYTGLPRLMKAPKERATAYTVVVILVMMLVGLVLGGIMISVQHALGIGAVPISTTTTTTSITHY